MRNPYIVGRWLRGADHYGRQRLIEYLLYVQDPVIWVVGTRRMGKTSLLRQLEWLLDDRNEGDTQPLDTSLVPLFWDLQGCETMDDLAYELFVSVEDKVERFEALGVDVDDLYDKDAMRILRTLQRTLRRQDRQLFLLIDESEALINVAQNDANGLARLRKTLQNGNQRTVMVATKLLMRLNDLSRHWTTSPFLFGVSLVNLWSLDPESSRDLILQEQNNATVQVDAGLLEEIAVHTHRHPYLTQYLCHRLFEEMDNEKGRLRPIEEDDLQADHLLAGFLQIDFDHLAPMERQILLTVARHGVLSEEALLAELNDQPANRVQMFLYGMSKLGYLRRIFGQWTVGNEFLRRWTVEHYDELVHEVQSVVSDSSVESLLTVGRQAERSYLQQELSSLQVKLNRLLEQRAGYGEAVPLALSTAIQEVRTEMADVSNQLQELGVESEPTT